MSNIEQIKALREATSVSLGLCTRAIAEAKGDMARAMLLLREWGALAADGRRERKTAEGRVMSYIHGEGRIGVLLQVDCESDFVAKGQEFQDFMHEACLQVAAMRPTYVDQAEVPAETLAQETALLTAKAQTSGKPAAIVPKIVQGQLQKWFASVCLLDQAWVKDPTRTIKDLLNDITQKTGENVRINRFARFEAGVAKGE